MKPWRNVDLSLYYESNDLSIDTLDEVMKFVVSNASQFKHGFRVEVTHPIALFAQLYQNLIREALDGVKLYSECYVKNYAHDQGQSLIRVLKM